MGKINKSVEEFMDNVACIYDYVCKPTTDERINFIEDILREHVGKKDISIIEFGCSTGENTFQLLERGYKVDGIDFSQNMIEIARNKNIEIYSESKFEKADMRNYRTEKLYDVVFSPSLIWLDNANEVKETVRCAYEILNQNGILILENLPNPKKFVLGCQPFYAQMVKLSTGCIYKITRFDDIKLDNVLGSQTYMYVDEDEQETSSETCNLKWRHYEAKELTDILKEIGFSKVIQIGDYGKKNIEECNKYQIIAWRD